MKVVFGIIGAIIVIVLVFVLVFRRPRSATPSVEPSPKVAGLQLSDYASTKAATVLEMDGKIVAEETHRSVRITVSQDSRTLEIIQGYNGNVIKTEKYPNTRASYSVFLEALDLAGFAKSKESTIKLKDGVCPLGNRYSYKVLEGTDTKQDLWSSSCSSKTGTFFGDSGLVRTLFKNQIPEYNKAVQGVGIS